MRRRVRACGSAGNRRAAVDGDDGDAEAPGVLVNGLRHLHRQLARRHEHEAAGLALAFGRPASRWSIGSAKAAVLPVPVAAWPSRSLPASSRGIALALDRRRLPRIRARLSAGGQLVNEPETAKTAQCPVVFRCRQ